MFLLPWRCSNDTNLFAGAFIKRHSNVVIKKRETGETVKGYTHCTDAVERGCTHRIDDAWHREVHIYPLVFITKGRDQRQQTYDAISLFTTYAPTLACDIQSIQIHTKIHTHIHAGNECLLCIDARTHVHTHKGTDIKLTPKHTKTLKCLCKLVLMCVSSTYVGIILHWISVNENSEYITTFTKCITSDVTEMPMYTFQ